VPGTAPTSSATKAAFLIASAHHCAALTTAVCQTSSFMRIHPQWLRDFGYSDPKQPTLPEYAEALGSSSETNAEI
jgi:hypothetical protein